MLNVSSNPHIRSKISTDKIMLAVIAGLLPALIFGFVHFGINAVILTAISVASCILFEYLFNVITKRKNSISDCSAIVTGVLLAMNLPSTANWWIPVIGAFFAIVVVKMLFGGLGQNFMNPALGARCFLLISFPKIMTNFNYDGVTSATPLQAIRNGEDVNLFDMFLGRTAGTIGETSALAIMVGGLALMLLGVIDVYVTFSYLGVFAVIMLLVSGCDANYMLMELCGGGIMLGAFFMATDYVTRPITSKGQLIYGIFLGCLTAIFRIFAPSAEGVSYAIIIGNLLVPLIDRISVPAFFGKARKGGKK